MRFIDRFYSYRSSNKVKKNINLKGSSSRAANGSGGSGGGGRRNLTTSNGRPGYLRRRNRRGRRRGPLRKVKGLSRKRRAMRPVDHSKNGVALIIENTDITSAVTDDAEAVYIGHANMPAANMINMAIRAILKAALSRFGKFYRNFDDQIGFSGSLGFLYYANPTATATTSINVIFVATDTLNNITGSIIGPLYIAMDNTPALRPYSLVITPSGGALTRDFYLDTAMLTMTAFSRLKIQNRTPNEAGTDEVDTNDINFLVGQKYSGNGTGTYLKAPQTGTPHNPFIGNNEIGKILVSRTDNMNGSLSWLRHPPETTKFFTKVKSIQSVSKFAPGATKYNSLYSHRRISFPNLVDMYLKEINTTQYMLSSMGKFCIYGFQKYIDDDEAVKIKIAYEVELQIGATCKFMNNIRTQPVYFET